jgi:predicted RNA-binding Zn-ribbon protein involved in translation (DUF1610 family)
MSSEKPQNQQSDSTVAERVRLMKEADAGKFEELECPKCGQAAVSVWFTHPAADEYRTWFICAGCGFHTRAHLSEKPANFSESRINTELQERDLLILKQARFKKPPTRLM